MIDYNSHTDAEHDNVGTEDDYPEEWARWDDLAVAAMLIIAVLGSILGAL